MTLVFGKLADVKGTKFALMLALLIYCFVAVTAAGFAPLELDPTGDDDGDGIPDDAARYDFTFTWEDGNYTMETLYDRGYEGWIGETAEGDAQFRDNFQEHFPEPDYSVGDKGESTIANGLLVCVVILAFVGILGGGIMFIQRKDLGWIGVVAMIAMVSIAILGSTFLADQKDSEEEEILQISESDATLMAAAFNNTSDHRFSILFVGGPMGGEAELGDRHPTVVDQGGPADGWATFMRDNVWSPLNISVSLQWIILGLFVGVAMGSAGAQARSMFSQLVPETRTSEFFGFFGFLGKSAAMIGTFLYGIASSVFDSRVAILTITIVILAGTFLTSRVDLEEGIRVAEEEDARARAEAAAKSES